MIPSPIRYRVFCYYKNIPKPVVSIFVNKKLALDFRKQVRREQKDVENVIIYDENDAKVYEN